MKAKRFIEEMSHNHGMSPLVSRGVALHGQIAERLLEQSKKTSENLDWLFSNMHPYFFITMKEEVEPILHLAARLNDVAKEKQITLADQEKKLILARLDVPGSIYESLRTLQERDISYAEMSHSYNVIPSVGKH